MPPIKVQFPGFRDSPIAFTEAHRRPQEGLALAAELLKQGVECVPELTPNCQACVCGSIWLSESAAASALAAGVPLIHYCWDLYPWQLEGKSECCWQPHLWAPYIKQLRACLDVWAPSRSAAARVAEFTTRPAHVILAAVHPWEAMRRDDGYVVDVMRPYPDRFRGAVARECRLLGIPCVETQASLPWPEYQKTIACARLLVSAYDEASTGGLSLLEGYALGVPVLANASERLGARDYFGSRADYFSPDGPRDLRRQIGRLVKYPREVDPAGARAWVEGLYSDAALARRIAKRLREVL
jgi:hypothetical protein